MDHTNKIAIRILTDEHSDYPRNAWHYDREYENIVRATELAGKDPKVIEDARCPKCKSKQVYYWVNDQTFECDDCNEQWVKDINQ